MADTHGRSALFGTGGIQRTVVTDNKSTIAEVFVDIAGERFFGVGSSRRVKEDAYNARTGELLATYRAVIRLASALKAEVDKIH